MTKIISIESVSGHRPTSSYGCYDVEIEINGAAHCLEYTYELREEDGLTIQAVTWKPEDSILADRNAVDVRAVADITDTIVQYHKTKSVQLPRIIAR
jgi:hypothetical protein